MPYEDGAVEFDKIVCLLGISREELFPVRKWSWRRLRPSKTNIRRLLGNWNPILHSMKINDAVNDIQKRIQNQEMGRYMYHSGKEIIRDGGNVLWENTCELIIEERESVFRNINRNQHYIFEGTLHDRNSNRR